LVLIRINNPVLIKVIYSVIIRVVYSALIRVINKKYSVLIRVFHSVIIRTNNCYSTLIDPEVEILIVRKDEVEDVEKPILTNVDVVSPVNFLKIIVLVAKSKKVICDGISYLCLRVFVPFNK
jgi:hypothetical protein